MIGKRINPQEGELEANTLASCCLRLFVENDVPMMFQVPHEVHRLYWRWAFSAPMRFNLNLSWLCNHTRKP